MKTLIVSLAALAAVSGAALAAGGDDLRSSDTYFGKFSAKHKMEGSGHRQQRVCRCQSRQEEADRSSSA